MELNKVEPGRIILVEHTVYDHYGIYAGNGQVIHYAKRGNIGDAIISKTDLREFLSGNDRFYVPFIPQNQADLIALIKYHKQRRSLIQELADELFNVYDELVAKVYTAAETLKRAAERIGEKLYSLVGNNCEHFAFWCKFRMRISNQISRIFDYFNDITRRNFFQRYHNCVVC